MKTEQCPISNHACFQVAGQLTDSLQRIMPQVDLMRIYRLGTYRTGSNSPRTDGFWS